MAIAKLRVGDSVKVIAGKSRNTVGIISKIDGDAVYVRDVNLVLKCVKKSKDSTEKHVGFRHVEAAIHRSNVAFFDSVTEQRVKVAIKSIDGKRMRVDRKTGQVLPEPVVKDRKA